MLFLAKFQDKYKTKGKNVYKIINARHIFEAISCANATYFDSLGVAKQIKALHASAN